MSRSEKAFSIAIRLVFVFAFGAFLLASVRHIAAFFHDFEPGSVDWNGSYALAASVDGTALMLTIGLMFFSRRMSLASKMFIWFFVVCLTGFSWLVNWEYAVTYQQHIFSANLDPVWQQINPILASSFAFLNMAYSIVAEVFSTREKSTEDLRKELSELTGERAELQRQIEAAKGPGLFAKAKQAAREIKEVKNELFDQEKPTEESVKNEPDFDSEVEQEIDELFEQNDPTFVSKTDQSSSKKLPDTDPEMHATNRRKTVPLGEENQPKKQQVRYTVSEAAKLPICRQKSIKVADIKAAIRRGVLEQKADRKLSKSAVEKWAKSFKKKLEAVA